MTSSLVNDDFRRSANSGLSTSSAIHEIACRPDDEILWNGDLERVVVKVVIKLVALDKELRVPPVGVVVHRDPRIKVGDESVVGSIIPSRPLLTESRSAI